MLEYLAEDLRDYLYDNGIEEQEIECDFEMFFRISKYDIDDFDIDGDYEGQITLSYIGD